MSRVKRRHADAAGPLSADAPQCPPPPSEQLQAQPKPTKYACVMCKTRKVLCDKKEPCSGCVRLGVECIGAKRKPYTRQRLQTTSDGGGGPDEPPAPRPTTKASETVSRGEGEQSGRRRQGTQHEVLQTTAPAFGQNLWTGLPDKFREPRAAETPASDAPHGPYPVAGTPLFDPAAAVLCLSGPENSNIDFKAVYPQPVHAFVMWQAFLQNVNPLSKVVYAPQVQDLVVQAAGSFDSLSTSSVALLFSIYAAAVVSLSDADCQAKLGQPKETLAETYRACALQALVSVKFLRDTSLVLLQAFALFLHYDIGTMWILTGMAVRMGQRLLATAPNTTGCSAFFDTQMRLRTWWQIVLIDGRVTQMCGQTTTFAGGALANQPLPANLNDSDMNPHMTGAPLPIVDRPTEMIFCLLRYEVGKFLAGKGKVLRSKGASTIAQRDAAIDELAALAQDRYLRFIDPAIPLHQIAEAGVHAALAKMRLMAHHPGQYPDKGASLAQTEHDMLFRTSVSLVGVLVRGFTATHLAHFMWHIDVYFQIDAVVFMLIEAQSQPPASPLVDQAWDLVGAVLRNKPHLAQATDELGRAVHQLVLRSWDARQNQARKLRVPITWSPPDTVAALLAKARQRRAETAAGQDTAVTVSGDQMESAVLLEDLPDTPAERALDAAQCPPPSFPGLDASRGESPFSTYAGADMDVLGWETTDWDSWDHWNTLLESQPL